MESISGYEMSSREKLLPLFVGKDLLEIPTPAAILDLAILKQNCEDMLNAIASFSKDIGFRAHIKTHKTSELTRYQIGHDCKDVRLVVSSVYEAEALVPLLQEYQSRGAKVNVLYGVPLPRSAIQRLGAVAKKLGEGSVSVMIDNTNHIETMEWMKEVAGHPISCFVKVDCGTKRAGLSPEMKGLQDLLAQLDAKERAKQLIVAGFYSHAGHSYYGSSPEEAMSTLKHEVDCCAEALAKVPEGVFGGRKLTVSVGATPTVASVQNLISESFYGESERNLQKILQDDGRNFVLELHAGVYPLLDMQQMATGARDLGSDATSKIALTILAEVCSIYRERDQPEAMIAAGSIALGREPCKSYKGWGVVSPWRFTSDAGSIDRRLIVSRISQEHGIVSFEDPKSEDVLPLRFGQKLRIWSNHACIASSQYSWYIVIDSSSYSPNEVKDVWVRWCGW